MSAEVAAEVLARLKRAGWIKGQMVSMDGFCLIGAINSIGPAHSNGMGRRDIAAAVTEVVIEQFPERCCGDRLAGAEIVIFNDHPETTFEDVQLVVEKAIARLKETA